MGSHTSPNSTLVGYHITTGANLPRILTEGLKPAIGARSKLMEEYAPGVHFFDSIAATKKGLKNWIGDMFDQTEALYVIECNLGNVTNLQQRSDSEIVSHNAIGIDRIRKVMTADLATFKVIQPPRILTRSPISGYKSQSPSRTIQRDLFG